MKTFYSLEDIEKLAAQGVRELIVDEDTVLTDVARDAAAQLGIRLAPPGRPAAPATSRPAPAPVATVTGGKPRGCQHGPLPAAAPEAARPSGPAGKLVDDLVGVVKQLAGKGSAG